MASLSIGIIIEKQIIDKFISLCWNDLKRWAGNSIVRRGQSYQQQGLVTDLSVLENGDLLSWVEGSKRYATKVTIGPQNLPSSICTCPYHANCKHGVATLLEYLRLIQNGRQIPRVSKDDKRLLILSGNITDRKAISPSENKETISSFLEKKSKSEIIELILDLAKKYSNVSKELEDQNLLSSGNIKSLVNNVRKDIRYIASEPGWQNRWDDEGYTPDYSDVCGKLEFLLSSGYPDEVLSLGRELIELGNEQIAQSNDEGETSIEIAECMPAIVKALNRSPLSGIERLEWAVEVILKDEYGTFGVFEEYLTKKHTKADWSIFADRMFKRLAAMKTQDSKNDFHSKYMRDRVTNWIVHSLEQSDRKDEIIPLCEQEAPITNSYVRLVERLLSAKRYSQAEAWIHKGIQGLAGSWAGIESQLRSMLKDIKAKQKDWKAIAMMQAEEFVRSPSTKNYIECQKANTKNKTWTQVRAHLIEYLQKGQLPWKQKVWPLDKSSKVEPKSSYLNTYPKINEIIDIYIFEKNPEKVLYWYEKHRKGKTRFNTWDDKIAKAIQTIAPERSVSIWQNIAEQLINETKPQAYEQSMVYLKKAESLMKRMKKQTQWESYIDELRRVHKRKTRFIQTLNQSDGKPIVDIKKLNL
ncbi:hypothetical protein SMSP2_02499 [Limihaloglobus sulfuriphilus]|uniref:SWIM-type domain-containing protein n=1 Tax=Limihaloglobus sulfuriphilus TaxID=1851148 RepID=A0A1Q2MHW7_9BACT|nr:SWIM zinc finger domain-containing protein [Limihaloglobus sulfuriphilus]AQQ72118.1 hypothetical protein SMSP2_02499 [Limihaloglobus sulfuriphilus]